MDSSPPITGFRDGRAWRIGDDAEVSWIKDGTWATKAITSAIPPVFETYATLELPEHWPREQQDRHDAAVIRLLTAHAARQPWWLGYLDTGAYDIVFANAPRTTLYASWKYVLVEAGPRQAASWRAGDWTLWKGPLPDLMFPADRSWLVSTLWDDDWTCIGGRLALIDDLLHDLELGPRARRVNVGDDDATPPGHVAI